MRGVIADPETAAKWYEKAAWQGSAKAQHNLAHLLQLGEGVARAPEEAVQWYLRPANQGSAKSAYRLGLVLSGRRRPTRLRSRITLVGACIQCGRS
jgi:TPR repeat protein